MVRKLLTLSAMLTGLVGFAGAAQATISEAGSIGGAATGVSFVNFDVGTSTASTASVCPVDGTVGLAFAGGAGFFTGTSAGLAAAPFLSGGNGTSFGFTAPIGASCGNQPNGVDTSQYIYAPTGGTVTITLPALEQYAGLLWGSVDPYNTLTFKNGATIEGSFTGTQIQAGANGNQGVNGTLYVNFNSDPSTAFNTLVLSSTGNSFEADNLAFNPTAINRVPEPLTLGLFGAGLAGLGFVRRRNARKT